MRRSTFASYASRLLAGVMVVGASAAWAQQLLLQLYPPGQLPPPALSLNFVSNIGFNGTASGTAASLITVVRAQPGGSNITDLLPTSSATYSYQTFAVGTPRITPGLGLLIEGTRTNLLLNSTAPVASQSATVVSGSVYTLWTNGGTATLSVCGTGTATTGAPLTFTASGTSCTVAQTGARAYQLELGPAGSSLIVTAAATAVRNFDSVIATGSLAISGSFTSYLRAIWLIPDSVSFSANETGFNLDDGTVTNHSYLARNAVNFQSFAQNTGTGAVTAQVTGMLLHAGIPAKQALAVTTNSQVSTQDGIAPASSFVAYTPPPMTTVRLGGVATGNGSPCFCYVQEVRVWPTTAFTMQQLQQLTSIYSQ